MRSVLARSWCVLRRHPYRLWHPWHVAYWCPDCDRVLGRGRQ